MKFTDYLPILRVAPEADTATVNTKYRTLALKWHLGVSKGTERRFTELGTFGVIGPKEAGFAKTNLHRLQKGERLLHDECDRQSATVPSQFRIPL